MIKQVFNPYLPPYEYVPDGEPHVFDDRLYIFGSHDKFGGNAYCENDYVCWSAPVKDLSDWRYDGVIYKKEQDPAYSSGKCLYAPDVCQGADGKYYLYYSLLDCETISVAVCDTPAGEYQFYGHVSLPSGRPYGSCKDDYYMFDPAVLVDGSKVYLYAGFHLPFLKKIKGHPAGAVVMGLDTDMKTIKSGPKEIMPASNRELGLHSFFEAPSVRKFGENYYFIYSSNWSHELCYCMSKFPDRNFVYKGVLHSNGDIGIGGKRFLDRTYPSGNNHGSIERIGNNFYVFGHRHTNNNGHTRQGVAEKLIQNSNGSFQQAEMTSCGLNNEPLAGTGKYPAYIACHLTGTWKNRPFITQDGADGTNCVQYITNIGNGSVMGFRYFKLHNLRSIHVTLRGNAVGTIHISTSLKDKPIGQIVLNRQGFLQTERTYSCRISEPLEQAFAGIYFRFRGTGKFDFIHFELETDNCTVS